MDIPTSLAYGLDAACGEPLYDEICKRILSEKIILAWILKYCVKEFADITISDIAEKYILDFPEVSEVPVFPDQTNISRIIATGSEDSSISEGTVTFDIRFNAILPIVKTTVCFIINVEAQNDFYPGYPLVKRAVYYCSRLISGQKDTVFTNSHYEKIQKVYSIWICTNPPKYREYSITEYSFSEKNICGNVKEVTEHYDLAAAVMICLGNQNQDRSHRLLDMLNTLLLTDIGNAEKKKRLSEEFDIPMTKRFEGEVDEMCNLSIGIERKAILKGIEEGIEKGIEESTINHIKNLMDSLNINAEAAMTALKLSGEDKQKYISMLG